MFYIKLLLETTKIEVLIYSVPFKCVPPTGKLLVACIN